MQRHQPWQTLLKGAFAFQTAPFAGHPLDEQRAVQMFHTALRAGASEEDIIAEAIRYLRAEGCHPDEIERQIARVRSFEPKPTRRLHSIRAWLVTLESADKCSTVISIFKYQRSPEFIREYMEQYYIDQFYTPQEKLLYAKSRKCNPHPAQYELLDGVPWQGRIICGHNPRLYGRLVLNLNVVREPDGERFEWEESPVPALPR